MSKNHISNVSNNTLNLSQNRVSALSIRYIEYFYHVFPLHVNSFNRLFSDVINLKLLRLITSVTQFTCLTSDIPGFKSNLEDVSNYLTNNPAESLLTIIEDFKAQTYVNGVKTDIGNMIEQLESKINYDEIIGQVYLTHSRIVSDFRSHLNTELENFKTNIEEHKKSLEKKIQEYLENIIEDLTKLCSCVKDLIELISKDIENLNENQSKVDQFTYKNKGELIKTFYVEIPNYPNDVTHFEKIVDTHKQYKTCLKESCPEIESNLEELKKNLQEIKECTDDLTTKLESYRSNISDTSDIDSVLSKLQTFTTNLDYNNYKESVEKLEKINEHMKKMKTKLNQVQEKVVKEAASYITGLAPITLTYSKLQENIKKIKSTRQLIIKKLEIAKSAIGFNQSLKGELTNLNVTFTNYDISEFNTNSSEITRKLTSFKSNIKPKLDSAKEAIQKAGGEIEKLKSQCQETQEPSNCQEDKLILCKFNEIQQDYTENIEKITSLINNSLEVIRVINYILRLLEDNKNKSLEHISAIKSEVSGITKLNDAITTKLPNINKELNKIVVTQQNTKSLIETFKGYHNFTFLVQYSGKLQDSISKSSKLLAHIDYYKGYLNTVENVDSIVKCIKSSYKSIIERINQIFDNFKTYVEVITSKLETINSNICLLKSTISACCTGYNNSVGVNNHDLGKLKEYMNNLKFYFTKIKTDFTTIKVFFEKIREESSYIDQNKCDLEYLKCVIESYINSRNEQNSEKTVIEYLIIIIKQKINAILKVKSLIINCNTYEIMSKIDCILKSVESSINELECAIEGVVRNMIRCSLKSLSKHLKTYSNSYRIRLIKNNPLIVNYSLLNVTNYNVVIDRLYEIWSFSDEATKLFKYTRFCLCVPNFESRNQSQKPSSFPYSLDLIMTTDLNPVAELAKNTMADNVGNHLCMCLVVKYHLRPAMLKCILYLRNEDLGTLSTISRKHDQYNQIVRVSSGLWKVCNLIIIFTYKITSWIRYKYLILVKNFCMCSFFEEKKYNYFISIILWLSSLIENIWTMDNSSIVTATNHLSNLLSEYQTIHVYTNYGFYPKVYSGDSSQPNKRTLRMITSNFNLSSALITRLNTKNALVRYYQIFSTLLFQFTINRNNTEIRINRQMNINVSNLYISMLKKKPTSSCTGWCKCGKGKIYLSIILMTNLYIKFALRIAIKEDLLYIMDLVKKNMFKEFLEIIKWIDYMNKETITGLELILRILKNNYSNFNTYRDHKTIANSFPGLTVGYGCEHVY